MLHVPGQDAQLVVTLVVHHHARMVRGAMIQVAQKPMKVEFLVIPPKGMGLHHEVPPVGAPWVPSTPAMGQHPKVPALLFLQEALDAAHNVAWGVELRMGGVEGQGSNPDMLHGEGLRLHLGLASAMRQQVLKAGSQDVTPMVVGLGLGLGGEEGWFHVVPMLQACPLGHKFHACKQARWTKNTRLAIPSSHKDSISIITLTM